MSKNKHPGFRPPANQILESPVHLVAFVGISGLSPLGPGTVGTLVGVFVWWVLRDLPPTVYLGLLAALFVFGCWVCGRSAKLIGLPDYKGIVFDEVVGFLIAATPLISQLYQRRGPLWPWLVGIFILFRTLDIMKPPPIQWFDRHVSGGLGIMIDDAVAGFLTAVVAAITLNLIP